MKKPGRKAPLWRKIWYFIWEDDSVLSWIVNVVIAFILIKYLVYPGLGLMFGTTHPVVAVVSGSMEHKLVNGAICGYKPDVYNNDFDSFWQVCGEFYREYDINKNDFYEFPLKNGFNTGDIIVLFGKKPDKINIGDIIVFQSGKPDPIIHRVINKWTEDNIYYFTTKGDHNPSVHSFESQISEDRIIGKAYFKIPFLGYIKLWFVKLLDLLGLQNSVGRLFQ
jgi:signal peptidase I